MPAKSLRHDQLFVTMYEWRILDHWDNPDGTIERGFAGHSIFWENPCEFVIRQYARANASVGINGAVLNNVNVLHVLEDG